MHMSRAAETLRWFLVPAMKAQQELGHYVCICTAEEADECIERDELSDAEHLRKEGFDVFTHGMKRSISPLLLLKGIDRVRKLLVEHKIEVIICHNPLGAIVGRLAARLVNLPCVIYFAHGLPCAPQQTKVSWTIRYCIEKFLGCFTDAILVMNNYDENLCKSHRMIRNIDKVLRIPGMGVDLSKFESGGFEQIKKQVAEELGFDKNKAIVISVARVIPEKGVFVFLQAAKEICSLRDDVIFVLAGNGPLMSTLKKYIEENNLGDRVRLLGWVQDVSRFVRASDIFALPSYYNEGLPVSILEAMACGKPVITTKHRGCEDAVADGQTGFLIPVKQVVPLVDRIMLLLDDKQLRRQMGRAGRKRVEQHFELGSCTDKIVQALEKAIS